MKVVFIIFITLFSILTILSLWTWNLRLVFSSLIFVFLSFMGLVLIGFKNDQPKYLNKKSYSRDKEV